jgi:hypothetical protein
VVTGTTNVTCGVRSSSRTVSRMCWLAPVSVRSRRIRYTPEGQLVLVVSVASVDQFVQSLSPVSPAGI